MRCLLRHGRARTAIYEEAAALWRELYGETPPPRIDGAMMLDMITQQLLDVAYDRLRSPLPAPVDDHRSDSRRRGASHR